MQDDDSGKVERDRFLLFEQGGDFDEEAFFAALKSATDAVETADVAFVLMGGLASRFYGRPRWTHDIDMMLRPEDAERALAALADAGFDTQKTYPDWLYKGIRDDVLVDLIFRSAGNIYLDDEMLQRATVTNIGGVTVPLIPPEDLLVIKAIVHDEHMPRHWHDCLGVLAAQDLDWDYLVRRSGNGARRMLSLLIYAQSNDLVVPNGVIEQLFDSVYR